MPHRQVLMILAKLGVDRRTDAVARARALGLLAPTPGRQQDDRTS
jgi:hypothetical protein